MSCIEMPLNIDKLPPQLREVIELFRRFPAITDHGACAALKCSAEARKKRMRRLFYSGWVESRPLPTGGAYWMLTRRGRKALGLPHARRKGLIQEQVIILVGTINACIAAGIYKIAIDTIEQYWPDLVCPGVPTHGYGIDRDERLVWFVVDSGASPERMAQRARKVVYQRSSKSKAWREVIDAGNFGVVLVAPSREKAASILAAIPAQHINPAVPINDFRVDLDGTEVPLLEAPGFRGTEMGEFSEVRISPNWPRQSGRVPVNVATRTVVRGV